MTNSARFFYPFFLLLFITATTEAAGRKIPLTETVHTKDDFALELIDALRDYIPHVMRGQGTPGLNLAVSHKGKLLWEAGFGHADLAQKTRMSPETVWHSGSLGKTYTATAVMQLVEQGLIKLDHDVSDYLPFKVKNPNGGGPVTLRHLLLHTSGLHTDPAGSSWSKPKPLATILAETYRSGDLRSWSGGYGPLWRTQTGEEWHYSNVGIATLGLIVETMNAEGLAFADYVQKHIMDPLGMTSAQYPPAQHKAYVRPDIWKKMSTGYTGMGSVWVPAIPVYFGLYPAGGVLQTPSDHLRLLNAMMGEGRYSPHPLLKSKTIEQMLSPEKAGRGKAITIARPGEPEQGLVWRINKRGEQLESFDHAGGHMFGWTTQGRAWRNYDLAVAIGSNHWDLPGATGELGHGAITGFIDDWLNWRRTLDIDHKPASKEWAWKVSYIRGVVYANAYNALSAEPGDMPLGAVDKAITNARTQAGKRHDWDPSAFHQGVADITEAGFTGYSIADFIGKGSKVSLEESRRILTELGASSGELDSLLAR